MFFTRAYGLSICVDHPLPGFREQAELPGEVDLFIYLTAPPPQASTDSSVIWRPHHRFKNRIPNFQGDQSQLQIERTEDGRYTRIAYSWGSQFIFDQSAKRLWITYPDHHTLDFIARFPLNTALCFYLRLRDTVCLHAAAIQVDQRALLIAGASGAGKSTLASYFALRHHRVMSDDVSVLQAREDGYYVQPGYPFVRLWRESSEALFGETGILSSATPEVPKQYLDLDVNGLLFAEQAMPIGAIYVLRERSSQIAIDPLKPSEALITLMSHANMVHIIDNHLRMLDMKTIGTLIESTPVSTVTPHAEIARLPDLYDAILNNFRQIRVR